MPLAQLTQPHITLLPPQVQAPAGYRVVAVTANCQTGEVWCPKLFSCSTVSDQLGPHSCILGEQGGVEDSRHGADSRLSDWRGLVLKTLLVQHGEQFTGPDIPQLGNSKLQLPWYGMLSLGLSRNVPSKQPCVHMYQQTWQGMVSLERARSCGRVGRACDVWGRAYIIWT